MMAASSFLLWALQSVSLLHPLWHNPICFLGAMIDVFYSLRFWFESRLFFALYFLPFQPSFSFPISAPISLLNSLSTRLPLANEIVSKVWPIFRCLVIDRLPGLFSLLRIVLPSATRGSTLLLCGIIKMSATALPADKYCNKIHVPFYLPRS